MSLNELRDAVHETARAKGWWDGREGEEVTVNGAGIGVWALDQRSFAELLMLVVSECAEALEDWRNGYEVDKPRWQVTSRTPDAPTANLEAHGDRMRLRTASETREVSLNNVDDRELLRGHGWYTKPIGIPSELADIIIRILDISGAYGVDIEDAVRTKMEFNETREVRHGGKRS
jgi:NTP pyrophosphatase (non-canonical NTP hydrolase)